MAAVLWKGPLTRFILMGMAFLTQPLAVNLQKAYVAPGLLMARQPCSMGKLWTKRPYPCKSGADGIYRETEVFINQQDIRQLQLAKAAVRAGMDTLMDTCGLDYSSLDQIVFMRRVWELHESNECRPYRDDSMGDEVPYRSYWQWGRKGAGAILQNRGQLEYSVQIVKEAETVELSMSSYFVKRYVKMMDFHEVME